MGKQQDHDAHIHLGHQTEENRTEYIKFVAVIAGIFLVTVLLAWLRGFSLARFLSDFMAVFFIVFAAFKFLNLEEFAVTYQTYDVIAKRFPIWGYAFPFIEGALGLTYLIINQSVILNLITMVITGTAAIGVFKEVQNKSNIMCACLGRVIKLPLSKVSFVEDVAMFVMAAIMIFV